MAPAVFACATASVGQRATIDTTARQQASAARLGELILDLLAGLRAQFGIVSNSLGGFQTIFVSKSRFAGDLWW
jgi:hypothetical protein